MESLRVLTFNSHQPYLHLLASALPWNFGVVTPELQPGIKKRWDPRIRPLPLNVHIYSSLQHALDDCSWDWVLAHNINDLLDTKELAIPKVFLVHGTVSGRILQDRSTVDQQAYLKSVRILLNALGARVVYISELKARDWGIPGEVILPGIDIGEYGGYRGDIPGILQVCNHLRSRGAMMGWETYQAVCQNLPSLVLGVNPGLPFSRAAGSWDDLKEQLRSYRVYLYTPVYPYEDGYNLSLLEAMATGMPIATLENESSPIRDGCEGVVGSSVAELREKVLYLLNNSQAAITMGRAARAKVEQHFPISSFAGAWQSFIETVVRT